MQAVPGGHSSLPSVTDTNSPSRSAAATEATRLTLATLVLTLAVRGVAWWLNADGLSQDPDDYRGLAENLLATGVLGHGDTPSAYRPPLYPLLLVPCVALGRWSACAIGALHLALGAATVWGVAWLGRHSGLGRHSERGRNAWLAAALVACDPILVYQSTQVMTETAATWLATVGLIALVMAAEKRSRGRYAAVGATLAMASLCRPTFLVWLACAVPWVVLRASRGARRVRLGAAGLAGAAVVLAPWMARNQWQLGRPIVSTTHGGYTLWLGNNRSYYDFLRTARAGEVWRATEFDERVRRDRSGDDRSEIDADRREYAQAWSEIGEQPRMFWRASLTRLGRLWGLVPRQVDRSEGTARHWGRYTVGAWYTAEFALAAWGLWSFWGRRREASFLLPGLLLAASFTAVHVLFWTDLRMRAPVEPVIALLAAAGAGRLAGAWARINRVVARPQQAEKAARK